MGVGVEGQSPGSQCLPSILPATSAQTGLGLPQTSVSVRNRTKDGSPTRRPFLVLGVLVRTAVANRKLPYPKLQLPPRAVPQAPPSSASIHGSHSRLEKSEPLPSQTLPLGVSPMCPDRQFCDGTCPPTIFLPTSPQDSTHAALGIKLSFPAFC